MLKIKPLQLTPQQLLLQSQVDLLEGQFPEIQTLLRNVTF